jgi:hypothetical protein
MARGIRLGKSKLAFSMQDLSLVDFETAGRNSLPSLISAKPLKIYAGLREDLSKTVAAFYATELMLKMTPDEEPNVEAYDLLMEFFEHLNDAEIGEKPVFNIIDSFSLKLMRSLGFSIEHASSAISLPGNLGDTLSLIMETQLSELPKLELTEAVTRQSHNTVKNFIEFILERNIKSEQLLWTTKF